MGLKVFDYHKCVNFDDYNYHQFSGQTLTIQKESKRLKMAIWNCRSYMILKVSKIDVHV